MSSSDIPSKRKQTSQPPSRPTSSSLTAAPTSARLHDDDTKPTTGVQNTTSTAVLMSPSTTTTTRRKEFTTVQVSSGSGSPAKVTITVDDDDPPSSSLHSTTLSNGMETLQPWQRQAVTSSLARSGSVTSHQKLKREKSLVKLDRSRSLHRRRELLYQQGKMTESEPTAEYIGGCEKAWQACARVVTSCFCDCCLKQCCDKHDPLVQQAWREKIALVMTSFFMCAGLGFLTFLFLKISCPPRGTDNVNYREVSNMDLGNVIIQGKVYSPSYNDFWSSHPTLNDEESLTKMTGADLSALFPREMPACTALGVVAPTKACTSSGFSHCHVRNDRVWEVLRNTEVADVFYEWKDVEDKNNYYFTYNGEVINMQPYFTTEKKWLGEEAHELILNALHKDATMFFINKNKQLEASCLAEAYSAGMLESETLQCISAQIVLNIALAMVVSVVVIRFVMAMMFNWTLSRDMGRIEKSKLSERERRASRALQNAYPRGVTAATHPQTFSFFHSVNFAHRYQELYTVCLVTCYSEGESGLRTTLDSLTLTDYDDQYKMILVIADGIVKGAGNAKATGDIVLDMIELDEAMHGPIEYEWVKDPKTGEESKQIKCRNAEPQSYAAVASGQKRHNMARVYVGKYHCNGRQAPVMLVYKVGTPDEATTAKPGNRGKRDSQMIFMDFTCKVVFDDRMSPLQYDMFNKMTHIMTVQTGGIKRVTPDVFEIVLMVDADTKVNPDSLTRMVAVMQRDPSVMGLCGETQIMNKMESWVTAIQVFEYHISHHLNKAFESMFGGVTCLPGCFCMYRIKTPKPVEPERRDDPNLKPEDIFWVPILSNPDIVADYSQTEVTTLHKKNLLLLGEDRYLTTLMLRTFPHRKMMFVPKAICETQVPSKFSILLSQRRRWINSTIHNLMELLLVRELCGTFCISMQFIVLLELIGTATLPAAIIFTLVLIISSIVYTPEWVPLILLFGILGLPAILSLTLSGGLIYIVYLIIYLISLPIWNFVLPVYAFWHFDDFSWGQTRMVEGEAKGTDSHGADHGKGEDAGEEVSLKRWIDWEMERRAVLKARNESDMIGVVKQSKVRPTSTVQSVSEKKGWFGSWKNKPNTSTASITK